MNNPNIRPHPPGLWRKVNTSHTFHHVIPSALLAQVWNRLVDQHIGTDRPEPRAALRQFLNLCDRNLQNVDDKLDRMRLANREYLEAINRKRAAHSKLEPLDTPDADALTKAAIWPAWNIVEGPGNRSDDPKDKGKDEGKRCDPLRAFDKFTVGLTPAEANRLKAAGELFERFLVFVSAGSEADPDSLQMLASDIVLIRRLSGNDLVGCTEPIPFREGMWLKDEKTGEWRKRLASEEPT